MSRWAAVLAGGSGTRFWPLSTPDEPKQFQAIAGDHPLLVQSVDRLKGLIAPERTLIVTGERFRGRTQELLPTIPPENVLGEPKAAATAAALTWASSVAGNLDKHACILSVHADWFVGNDTAFRSCADQALSAAEQHDALVTVGITPTRPESGYGYIVPAEEIDGGTRRVGQFIEKPNTAAAEQLIKKGALWNCGMFAWTAERFFKETMAHAPEIAPHVELLRKRSVQEFFESVTPIVIDKSHLERSARVVVVSGTFPWDDVGTWNALSRVTPLDASNNVMLDGVIQRDSSNCVVWPDGQRVALFGVNDLVVARSKGITLVTTRDRAANLKAFVEELPPEWINPE